MWSEARIDRVGLICGGLGLLGIPWLVGVHFFNLPGVGTAMFGVFAMTAYGSLYRYKVDPGLWMLALFFALMAGGFWGIFTAARFVPSMRGTIPPSPRVWVDAAGCTAIMGTVVRLCLAIAHHNRTYVRPTRGA